MKRRYKYLIKDGKVYIMYWVTDGVLFGPGWECIASFEANVANNDRCKSIVRLMNECDKSNTENEDD